MDQSVLEWSIFSTDRRSSLQLSYFDEEEGKETTFLTHRTLRSEPHGAMPFMVIRRRKSVLYPCVAGPSMHWLYVRISWPRLRLLRSPRRRWTYCKPAAPQLLHVVLHVSKMLIQLTGFAPKYTDAISKA